MNSKNIYEELERIRSTVPKILQENHTAEICRAILTLALVVNDLRIAVEALEPMHPPPFIFEKEDKS